MGSELGEGRDGRGRRQFNISVLQDEQIGNQQNTKSVDETRLTSRLFKPTRALLTCLIWHRTRFYSVLFMNNRNQQGIHLCNDSGIKQFRSA